MDSLPDAGSGRWIRPLLDPGARDMHCVVPHGYAAYARVFHPAIRDRPTASGSWHRRNRFAFVDIATESVPWSAVARAFGTTMHALAQCHRLPGAASEPYGEILDAEGWRGLQPADLPFGRRDNPSNSTRGDRGPGPGLLPASVVTGPKLELPGRSHFLYSAAPAAFT